MTSLPDRENFTAGVNRFCRSGRSLRALDRRADIAKSADWSEICNTAVLIESLNPVDPVVQVSSMAESGETWLLNAPGRVEIAWIWREKI
ncbi:MAG: hypothetical protein Fues2KO_01620 [Fuerstiella sp.]